MAAMPPASFACQRGALVTEFPTTMQMVAFYGVFLVTRPIFFIAAFALSVHASIPLNRGPPGRRRARVVLRRSRVLEPESVPGTRRQAGLVRRSATLQFNWSALRRQAQGCRSGRTQGAVASASRPRPGGKPGQAATHLVTAGGLLRRPIEIRLVRPLGNGSLPNTPDDLITRPHLALSLCHATKGVFPLSPPVPFLGLQ